MDKATETQVEAALTTLIQDWLENDGANINIGVWLGDNCAAIMAWAATCVLAGMDDAQKYLKREGMLKDSAA